ncbi:small subunit ribosomal protein S24e [Enteropsectra breve]|nr:small subunit ribosomal protein S24e [Enteropsectra breve]
MAATSIKVAKSFVNALLNRRELTINITHPNKSTPTKELITSEISPLYSVPAGQIYVYGIKTGFGSHQSVAYAHLYKSMDDLKSVEREFVVERMTGVKRDKIKRRQRKDNRIKAYKMFGTLQRNMKKAAKRSED